MKKFKFLFILLIFIITIFMVACGESNNTNDDNNKTDGSNTTENNTKIEKIVGGEKSNELTNEIKDNVITGDIFD